MPLTPRSEIALECHQGQRPALWQLIADHYGKSLTFDQIKVAVLTLPRSVIEATEVADRARPEPADSPECRTCGRLIESGARCYLHA